MKKILYFHAGAELYGADKVLLDLVTNLDKNKYKPVIVLPTQGPLVGKLQDNNIEVYVVEYPILRRKYFNLKGIFTYPFKYLKAVLNISKKINISEYDIIHVNTTAVLEGIYFKILFKKKIIWHIHEILLKPKFLFMVTSYLVQKFSDKIIVVSEAVKSHLTSIGFVEEKNFSVVYNGVNNTIYNPDNDISYLYDELKIPKNSKIVGMIGRVNSWKGQTDFLEAVIPLIEEDSSIYAILVGGVFPGEEYRMEYLKEKVAKTYLKSNIRIIDFREDIHNVHCLFDIFVLPSIQPDPLPTVVLEAMASKKPIVAYNHGGVTEMVNNEENGLLCEIGNTEKLSKNIKLLLNNLPLQLKMGDSSLVRQKKFFSLDSYVRNMEKIYDSMNKK